MSDTPPSPLARQLDRLQARIDARRGADLKASYTAQLLADPARAAKKLGEEAVEAAIAAAQLAAGGGDRAALTAEMADVFFHALALMAAAGVAPEDVARELERREALSGLEEKAARPR